MLRLFVAIAVFLAAVYGALGEIETNEIETTADEGINRGRLIKDIFKNYDKRNYPSNNTLKMGVALIRFDVEEQSNNLKTDVWIRQSWTDKRLAWDPAEYGGETVVRIAPENVWTPDLSLYNRAAWGGANECRDTNVLVYSTGKVLWVPPCQFRSLCNLTLDVNPYGEQTCQLKFGSWTFDGFLLDLQFYDHEKADLSDLWETSDYEITGNKAVRVNKKYDCCAEPYPYIQYDLTFQRKRSAPVRIHRN